MDPWGEVLATCDHTDAVIVENVDLKKVSVLAIVKFTRDQLRHVFDQVREMRQNIPTSLQKRFDLY